MATDEDGDVVMAEAPVPEAAAGIKPEQDQDAGGDKTASEAKDGNDEPGAEAESKPAEVEVPIEERVTKAEHAKNVGNELLKQGNLAAAVVKYVEGIDLTESLLEKDPVESGEDLIKRATVVYQALRLNSAQACLKQQAWADACEHADKVISIDKDNCKALYRRAMASIPFDTEGRLEQARLDLARLVQLEPANREAREQLTKTKERLKSLKQEEKERYAKAMKGGGMYKEQHDKLARQQLLYEEEVSRRKEKGEDEISFEDWQKKRKEAEDEEKKKEKEEREKSQKEAAKAREQAELDDENRKRAEQGLEELTLDAWRDDRTKNVLRKEEVVKTDELDLDEEEKKLLDETKKKGYYHGRLGTVLSNEAPKPKQVEGRTKSVSPEPASKAGVSEWNQAGTWEEKDATSWAKEELTKWLKKAHVSGGCETPKGESLTVTGKVYAVKSLNGDAQILVVRKQPRHGFNFDAELSFSLSFTSTQASPEDEPKPETLKGKIVLPELTDTVSLQEMRMDATWKDKRPSERLQSLAEEWVGKLKENLREQIGSFVEEYKKR